MGGFIILPPDYSMISIGLRKSCVWGIRAVIPLSGIACSLPAITTGDGNMDKDESRRLANTSNMVLKRLEERLAEEARSYRRRQFRQETDASRLERTVLALCGIELDEGGNHGVARRRLREICRIEQRLARAASPLYDFNRHVCARQALNRLDSLQAGARTGASGKSKGAAASPPPLSSGKTSPAIPCGRNQLRLPGLRPRPFSFASAERFSE